MLQGPLRPLTSQVPLRAVLEHARPEERLGAWVSACSMSPLHVRATRHAGGSLLLSQDLGFLLSRCGRVVVRREGEAVALSSDAIISWRAIQVVTATPYLPGMARLRKLLPGLRSGSEGFLVPVRHGSPEEVLALCAGAGVRVSGSRIVYVGKA